MASTPQRSMDNYLDDYREEYYEEEIIEDDLPDGLWDVEAIEESEGFHSSYRGHPFDEATMVYSESEFSCEEEKTEIVPAGRMDPPQFYPHQLQPIEQIPQSKTAVSVKADQPSYTIIGKAQKSQVLPAEEPSSVASGEGMLSYRSSHIEQPSGASCGNGYCRSEARALVPERSGTSVVDIEEDYVFPEIRMVQYKGNALVPYDDLHDRKGRKRMSPLWGCALFLCLLLLLLLGALVLLYFFVLPDSDFFFWRDDDASLDPTNAPTTNNSPLSDVPIDTYGPVVTCSGRVTTLTEAAVAKYEALVTSLIPTIYRNWDHSMDSCHPANQALLWTSTYSNVAELELLEPFIMALFYFSTEGFDWRSQRNWLSHEDICEWEGVACTGDGKLLRLDRRSNGLKGPLVKEIGYLTSLQVLNLQSNALSGSLPIEFTRLHDLSSIDLSRNRLVDTIPSHIGNLQSLEYIKLNGNRFSGSIASELGRATNLQELDLGQNNFRAELPAELNLLSKLRFLNLDNNAELTGRIPTEYGLFTDLSFFSISNTAIRARLPSQYGALTKLEELHMANTLVGGDIPPEIANMTSLRHIDLSGSRFRKPIPTVLGTLSKLTHLALANNSLTGWIPTEIGLLSNLSLLSCEDNLLSGSVPSELGAISKLETLFLHHNFLTGRISDQVCSLREFDLEFFIVPCPTRTEDGEQLGIACAVPSCCSACLGSAEDY